MSCDTRVFEGGPRLFTPAGIHLERSFHVGSRKRFPLTRGDRDPYNSRSMGRISCILGSFAHAPRESQESSDSTNRIRRIGFDEDESTAKAGAPRTREIGRRGFARPEHSEVRGSPRSRETNSVRRSRSPGWFASFYERRRAPPAGAGERVRSSDPMSSRQPLPAQRLESNVRRVFCLTLCAAFFAIPVSSSSYAAEFIRGDANTDGRVSLADIVSILRHLHLGRPVRCEDAADVDDSGKVTTTDFVYLLGTLFFRHAPPPAPYPELGRDETGDPIGCRTGVVRRDDEGGEVGEVERRGDPIVEPQACDPFGAGADTELIIFLFREIHVAPGTSSLRVPIKASVLEDIEGLTLSVRADPPVLDLVGIDFDGTVLDPRRRTGAWFHSFTDRSGDGFVASTLVFDVIGSGSRLGLLSEVDVAHLEFAVPEDVEPGTVVDVRFETTPTADGLPPIDNELVRGGRVVPGPLFCGFTVHVEEPAEVFVRGDADRNGRIEFSDATSVLSYLFRGGPEPECPDAADADDNGHVELNDALLVLRYLFRGERSPDPYLVPGLDETDDDELTCAQ